MSAKAKVGLVLGIGLGFVLVGPVFASENLFDVDSDTVALWRFNDMDGSFVKDETGINNGTAIGTQVVEGKFGKARSFNGQNEYITVPDSPNIRDLSQITIEAWVYPTGFNLGCWNAQESILTKGGGDVQNAYNIKIWRNQDDGCGGASSLKNFYLSAYFGGAGATSPVLHEPDNWYYTVLTYDGSNIKLFVNGELESSQYSPNLIVNSRDPLLINEHTWGGGSQSFGRMAGVIDEIRLSNVARSAEEIANNYRRGTENVKNPVLVIPGIFGSFGIWLDPFLGTYDFLVDSLKNSGYVEGKDLFLFPYDWEKDNKDSATKLADKLEQIKSICNCGKVDIIAHSMGGLVAREYIESPSFKKDIGKLIFLGTPQMGSPSAYLMWEAGEDDGIPGTTTIFEFVVSILAREDWKNRFRYAQSLPSLKELLPVYDYLKRDGVLTSYPANYPTNNFLDNQTGLNSSSRIGNLAVVDKTFNILGFGGSNTISAINVENKPELYPLWQDGAPTSFEMSNGDGAVPEASNVIFGADYKTIEISSKHSDLPTESWPEVSEILTGVKGIIPPKQPETTLIIAVHSPVDFYVVDPNGNKLGKDFNSVTDFSEIPRSFYSGSDNQGIEFVSVRNPIQGEYKIFTSGTGSGEYVIQAGYSKEDDSFRMQELTAQTKTDLTEELNLNLNSDIKITPQDSIAPTSFVKVYGTSGLNGWYVSNVNVEISAEDNLGGTGVLKTEYSLDGGKIWAQYGGPFVLSEGKNNLLIRSEDFMGNKEGVRSIAVNVDNSPPEARAYFDPNKQDLVVKGFDNLSSTTVSRDKTKFLIQDEAGHTLAINFGSLKREGNEMKAHIKNLVYNNSSPTSVPENSIKYEWSTQKNGLIKELEQKIDVKGQFSVQAKYGDGVTKMGKDKLSGLVLLNLVTDSGKILLDE